jgi:hypothetical protein
MPKLYRSAPPLGRAREGVQTDRRAAPTKLDELGQTWSGPGAPTRRSTTGTALSHGRSSIGAGRLRAFAEADMFWIYWDTAWSIIISGIMFATIVAHPDAEFAEVRSARES